LDVLVITATSPHAPSTYADFLGECRGFNASGSAPDPPYPVMSVLVAGGGVPVVSSGIVTRAADGDWLVFLPMAPGTSGAPVVDAQGRLVGIVSTGYRYGSADAGVGVTLAPGRKALELVASTEAENGEVPCPGYP
jgi:hypothetical protein